MMGYRLSGSVVYLDNNATTRPDPRVIEAMLPFLTERYGNPASLHHFGASVTPEMETARGWVARAIGARDSEIVFTSGGTESNNLALRGVLTARPAKRHVVISTVEHHAILEPAAALEREGVSLSRIVVDGDGRLDLTALDAAIRSDTALVSIMLVNNETGIISPIREVSEIVRRRGTLLHCDAVNAFGKLPINVESLGADLLSLSAHKIHGPKGCGALYIRRGTPLRPLIAGGPQERQLRGGTSNVASIVGFGKACELFGGAGDYASVVGPLRDRLEGGITQTFEIALVAGHSAPRVANTSCVCFAGINAEPVILLLSEAGICVSSGAACSSGSLEPSHVIAAMGIDPRIAQGQVRFSLSRLTTESEIDRVLAMLPRIIEKVAAVTA